MFIKAKHYSISIRCTWEWLDSLGFSALDSWRKVVGRLLSYWEGNCSGAMLNFWGGIQLVRFLGCSCLSSFPVKSAGCTWHQRSSCNMFEEEKDYRFPVNLIKFALTQHFLDLHLISWIPSLPFGYWIIRGKHVWCHHDADLCVAVVSHECIPSGQVSSTLPGKTNTLLLAPEN